MAEPQTLYCLSCGCSQHEVAVIVCLNEPDPDNPNTPVSAICDDCIKRLWADLKRPRVIHMPARTATIKADAAVGHYHRKASSK